MQRLAIVLLCCAVILVSANPEPHRGRGGGRGGGRGRGRGRGGGHGGESGCTYWCRTPEGAVYCCGPEGQTNPFPTVKPGSCPPVRPSCPPVRTLSIGPPQTCAHDNDCLGRDKCCYDTCLREHVCKPPFDHYG